MEKRAILFVILSTMVMLVFYALQPQKATQSPAPSSNKAADQSASSGQPAPSGQSASSGQPATITESAGAQSETNKATGGQSETGQSVTVAPDAFVTVDTPLYRARISSRGGTIASWVLKGYNDDNGKPLELIRPGSAIRALAIGSNDDFSLSDSNFEIQGRDIKLAEDSASQSLTFTYSSGASTIRRTMEFMPNTYSFKLRDEVAGIESYQITLGESFGIYYPADSYTHSGGVYLIESDREELKPGDLDTPQNFTGLIKWIANEDKYFCSAIVPKSPVTSIRAWKLGEDRMTISLIATGASHEALIFAGPKEHDRLAALGNGLEYIVDFGFFSLIARPIFWLMKQIYAIVGNYGWAIVLLTIIIRVPFIPLVNKGQKSMKEMQALQPRIKELKEKHKNNAEKMNQEMMELYRKHKVNPLGGCLPILVQIPVFFALYKVLLIAIELRGAPWIFWIKDLSVKDPYYVMPIIMGATMFIQQKLTPSASPDPMQQKIMTYLPVIFTFMFLTFPSGLVLYWLVNNLLSIAQQLYVNNKAVPATK